VWIFTSCIYRNPDTLSQVSKTSNADFILYDMSKNLIVYF
jgi:hypothetical protein